MVNPIMVEAIRGRHVESYHRGSAAVVDPLGNIIRNWGDIQTPVFGRSALKLIQALPLIEQGAAEAYHLSPEEIALACASHHGEIRHVNVLETWLKKIGKDERILECGTHRPLYTNYLKPNQSFTEETSALQNACSGKHLGMLTTALHRNEPLEGYFSREHPVQKRVEHALAEMTNVDTNLTPHGTDGCGIPTFAFPLFNIALAMARIADPSHLPYPRQKAIQTILAAIIAYPDLLTGYHGFDTLVIKMTKGTVICKGGAGGIHIGILPSLGLGVALKIDDGNSKASELAFLAILRSLGALDDDLYEKLNPRFPITTHKGKTIGFLQPTAFTTLLHETSHH